MKSIEKGIIEARSDIKSLKDNLKPITEDEENEQLTKTVRQWNQDGLNPLEGSKFIFSQQDIIDYEKRAIRKASIELGLKDLVYNTSLKNRQYIYLDAVGIEKDSTEVIIDVKLMKPSKLMQQLNHFNKIVTIVQEDIRNDLYGVMIYLITDSSDRESNLNRINEIIEKEGYEIDPIVYYLSELDKF